MAWLLRLGSEPGSTANTLLDSKGRILLTTWARTRTGKAMGRKSRWVACCSQESRFWEEAAARRRATSNWIQEASLRWGTPSARRYERSPPQELRTTSQP